MHSRKRDSRKMWTIAVSGLILATFAFAPAAQADPRGHRHDRVDRHGDPGRDRTAIRDARRYDRRLDARGRAIDFQLDLLAMVAAANGEYALAEHLDRKGDRIERRLDRRGDRALRDLRSHRPHAHTRSCGHMRRHGGKHLGAWKRGHGHGGRHLDTRKRGHGGRHLDARRHGHAGKHVRGPGVDRSRNHASDRKWDRRARAGKRDRRDTRRSLSHVDAIALHARDRLR